MIFSHDEMETFRSDGYARKDGFFDERETRAIQNEVSRLKDAGKLRNVATDGDGKTSAEALRNLQLCPMYNHSRFFRALPFHPQVVGAVSELIGDPHILHLDQVFLKPGGDGMGTNWHQDNAYFKITDPMRGTAMWISVHDATLENGTMSVIPGSFREWYEHSRDPFSNHHIRCYPPEDQAVPIELSAGSVLFFCYGTAHRTGANGTRRERAGVAFHFLHADHAQKDLVASGRDYRPFMTGPSATGGAEEYGEVVAGTWESEVETVLSYTA